MKEHEYVVFLEAISYINEHMAEPLQVADIARAIHVSESRLQRSFRACADTSVHEYLLRMKLSRAMEELRNGERIGNVANRTGFTNRNHFSYCFKKEIGINPSQAKKKQECHKQKCFGGESSQKIQVFPNQSKRRNETYEKAYHQFASGSCYGFGARSHDRSG